MAFAGPAFAHRLFMRYVLGFVLSLLLATSALALDGRYEVQGVGPEGSYDGTALLADERDGTWSVSLKTHDTHGAERLAEASARLKGTSLRFTVRATREGIEQQPLRVSLRLSEESRGFVATYVDAERRVVRRECWLRSDMVRIPIQVVALSGSGAFPGVGGAQADEAQAWVLAQLNAVFGALDVEFRALTPRPLPVGGARYDVDRDGQLSLAESRTLRDDLEVRGIKRRGRVVLVLTEGAFAHGECRGWTLGDAPASPGTLCDLNDNFSLVGLRYLDPLRFHTVAHEVGHQLGLDDLNPANRRLLASPQRDDHLMVSGGSGLHLDPIAASMLERCARGFPDHGLEGRLKPGYVVPSEARPAALDQEGLPSALSSQASRRPAPGR